MVGLVAASCLMVIVAFAAGCGGSSTRLRPFAGEDKLALQVDCSPPNAEVLIDGIWQGSCNGLKNKKVVVTAGQHTLAVRAEGCRQFSGSFSGHGVMQKMSVRLDCTKEQQGRQ